MMQLTQLATFRTRSRRIAPAVQARSVIEELRRKQSQSRTGIRAGMHQLLFVLAPPIRSREVRNNVAANKGHIERRASDGRQHINNIVQRRKRIRLGFAVEKKEKETDELR
jgi:hypothetical protein